MALTLMNESTNTAVAIEDSEIGKSFEKPVSIIEYAETEMATFAEKPFSEVDSLVLSQLCYMNLESEVPSVECNAAPVRLQALYMAEKFGEFTEDTFMPRHNLNLLKAVCASPRFRDIEINYYVNMIDEISEKQFSAMTFFLPCGSVYVAYRGTDSTINGWKEDFNMFFMDVIPGQLSAVEYLNTVAQRTCRPLYVGGHSKGGNLAMYAASFADKTLQDRIITVFNHDGPGLTKGAVAQKGYSDISSKINTTLPHSSLIGLIFCNTGYSVVDSDRIGIMQHDPFSWQIVRGEFVYEEKVKSGANKLLEAVYELMDTLSGEDRELFVDTVFDIIYSAGATTFSEFPVMAIRSHDKIIQTMKSIDPQTADKLKMVISELIKILARQNFRIPENETTQKLNDALAKFSEKTDRFSEKLTESVSRISESTENIRDIINTRVSKAKGKLKQENTVAEETVEM